MYSTVEEQDEKTTFCDAMLYIYSVDATPYYDYYYCCCCYQSFLKEGEGGSCAKRRSLSKRITSIHSFAHSSSLKYRIVVSAAVHRLAWLFFISQLTIYFIYISKLAKGPFFFCFSFYHTSF